MSYDLYFLRRKSMPTLSRAEVADYFESRPHFQVSADGSQIAYGNERTQVYFFFEWSSPEDDEEVEDDLQSTGLAFNLNYFRPRFFGLEAERELTAFVEKFDLQVFDPQIDGMGRGAYTPEGFLRGWEYGNRAGYHIAAKESPLSVATLPGAELERIWKWNLQSGTLQQTLGHDVFVPRIFTMRVGDEVYPVVSWADAITIALPKVPKVILARPKWPLLGYLLGKFNTQLVAWEDLASLLPGGTFHEDPETGGYYLLGGPSQREPVQQFFKQLRNSLARPEIVPLDRVFDREQLDEVNPLV